VTPDDVRHLIGQGWDMPDGPGQIAAAEEAVRHADALGDRVLAFDARMLATSAYHRGGEPAKSFVTFSWCLSDYDADPVGEHDGVRTAENDRLLRWFFKYVVSSLPKFPEIPLERTRAVLEDMERRYRAGGHSLHAVYNLRWLLARHVGDLSGADGWYARWCAAPRDENSDCAGCDPTEKVMHLSDRGRDAEAVALAEPVLAGHLTCSEQPQSMLTELLMPYLRTGRLEQARDAHRRAYRAQRGNIANMVDVSSHLVFCALTGNEARGLEMVQRHLDWLDRAPSPYAEMEFTGAAALVLRRLTDTGHGGLKVHRRAAGDREAADVAVADLAGELGARAMELAARFDARNGGTHQGDRIARRLEAEPIVELLPLSVTARRRTPAAAAATMAAAAGRRAATIAAADPDIPAGATAEELLDLAERYGRIDRSGAARSVLRAFDERFGDAQLTPLLAARRADGRGNDLAECRDVAGAERAWRQAIDGYRAAGDELRAHVAMGRLGVLLCLIDRPEDGLPLVTRSRDFVLAHGSAERRAGAHSRLGIALVAAGRPAEALPEFDRAAVEADGAGDP
jgi:cellulose synthase operon protein C